MLGGLTGIVNPRHVLQELVQRLCCITAEVVELVHQDLRGLVRNGRGGDGQRFVSEEVAIVRCRELRPKIYNNEGQTTGDPGNSRYTPTYPQ